MIKASFLTLFSLLLHSSRGFNSSSPNRRRFVLDWMFVAGVGSASTASTAFAETIGKDLNCNSKNCLGVWDGLLADCPHGDRIAVGAGCVSSQDDTPGTFAEPWDYSETNNLEWEFQQKRLILAIETANAQRNEQVRIVFQQGRYMRVVFEDSHTLEQSIGEFYFTPDDTTVQFRLASMSSPNYTSLLSLRNMDRSESIRQNLGYLKLPVLRNRRRTFIFGESDLDTFGPGSVALGPPAEMTTGELDGLDRDVNPKLKIDLLQQFPRP